MAITDQQDLEIWLAVIALTGVIQLTITCVALYFCMRFAREASTTVREMERRHIEPLTTDLHALVKEARDVTQRIRRLDDSAHATAARIGQGASQLKSIALGRLNPVWAILRGVGAGLAALAEDHAADAKPDPLEVQRFEGEGGRDAQYAKR